MLEAVVFGGQNSLDFSEVRSSVVRIPEVSMRIEEAQNIWDKHCGSSFSFQHFLLSENTSFFNNINLKSLSLAVVQLGLLDRYQRIFHKPQIIVGNTQNDSATLVAAGLMTFSEMILKSQACSMLRPMSPLHNVNDVVLKGRMLPQFQAFQFGATGASESKGAADMKLHKVLTDLVAKQNVKKIIHIGPGFLERAEGIYDLQSYDVQIVESIDNDPMLGWFWAGLHKQGLSFDQAQ